MQDLNQNTPITKESSYTSFTMDWFSWLSKTSLDPSYVYQYGLSFSQNELEEGDIAYFNHEFLQSMGVSIAKHRLEMLKLARKVENGTIPHPVSRILKAFKQQTKRCLSKYLWTWARCEESALVVVPRRSYSARWRSGNSVVKRNKRVVMPSKQSRSPLLITSGTTPMMFPSSRINSFSSPLVSDHHKFNGDGDFDEYWPYTNEDLKWDVLFQNMKPT